MLRVGKIVRSFMNSISSISPGLAESTPARARLLPEASQDVGRTRVQACPGEIELQIVRAAVSGRLWYFRSVGSLTRSS
jgi:hypothetical protein